MRLHEDLRQGFINGELATGVQRKAALRALRTTIKQHEEELLEALRLDLGKPPVEAYASEIGFCYQEIDHAIASIDRWMRPRNVDVSMLMWPTSARSYHFPKGVVLIVSPWNYPFHLALAPLIAALSAGCHAVVKLAEEAPHSSAVVRSICEAAFAKTQVAVVEGDGATVVPALMAAGRFDHVFYTGSTRVGREIGRACGEELIPCTLELGGKSPALVLADARLNVAADRILWGKMYNAGQTCVAPDYVLVERSVYESFVDLLRDKIVASFGKSPIESADFARIVNRKHFERLRSLLVEGRILHGGESDAERRFIGPTLLTDVDVHGPLMTEEIFGPLLPIIPVDGFAEAKSIIARNPNPLAAYCFTESEEAADRFISEVSFGGGCINDCLLHLNIPDLPFGGVQQSGLGRYHGDAGFLTFSNQRSIARTSTLINLRMKYAPYHASTLKALRRFLG